MDNLFRTHLELTTEHYSDLWANCLFVFDSNVLLDLYRLPETARVDLLNILSDAKINTRIWLPFQVLLEFSYNKVDIISDQKNKFNAVKTIVNDSLAQIEGLFEELQKKLSDLQLKKRHSVINPDAYINETLFKPTTEGLTKFLTHLDNLDKKQPDVNDKDEIRTQILQIFKDKVGKPFEKDELESIYQIGEKRYKENTPPGYKDQSKEGFYMYEDKKLIRKFGDLIVWKEIMRKCLDDNISHVILVTGDSKEDWWQEKRGKKIGPRFELLNEIYYEAKNVKLFHMYDTSSFMQYAKKHFDINIKQQSIDETKDLLEFSRAEKQPLINFSSPLPMVKTIQQIATNFSVTLDISVNTIHTFIHIRKSEFEFTLAEIFYNVRNHAANTSVSARIYESGNDIILRFRNKLPDKDVLIETENHRISNGLKAIKKIMQSYGGRMSTIKTEMYFTIRLRFRKDYFS